MPRPADRQPPNEPAAEAVAERLRQRLLSGLYLRSLRLGEKLPGLRRLAAEFGVDVRTVRRACQLLEREGLVELRARSGIYFAPAAERPRAPLSPRSQWLVNVALEGLSRAIPLSELATRVAEHTRAAHIRVACVECNDDQTAALCGQLQSAFGLTPVDRDVDTLLRAPRPADALRDVDLLVTTPFHAGEVEELARSVARPWLSMEPRSNTFLEIERLLADGPVYFVVRDRRFATKLRKIFANDAHGDRFHALVAEDDDVRRVPEDAPLYVTQLARERLGRAAPARARPASSMFAPASSRELIAFIVAHNLARAER